MKHLGWTRRHFPFPHNGRSDLAFTCEALIRAAAMTACRSETSKKTVAAQADIQMRIAAIVSALDMSGRQLRPTPEFLADGVTSKGTKSEYVGNTLCAHAANAHFHITWLLDVEKLPPEVVVKRRGTQRPDFLGQSKAGNWFVFESKGRSAKPKPAELKAWKRQATSIRAINGRDVTFNIVSSAFLDQDSVWDLLWVDPDDRSKALDVSLDDATFFTAYYAELVQLLEMQPRTPSKDERWHLVEFPDLGVAIGLHRDILAAFRERAWDRIRAFASSTQQVLGNQESGPDGLVTFADGVAVRCLPVSAAKPRGRSRGTASPPPAAEPPGGPSGDLGAQERATQSRIITLFRQELGYRFLGNWALRDNSNVEAALLGEFLQESGYTPDQISRATHLLTTESGRPIADRRGLYDANHAVYRLLRYGVPVKTDAGKPHETVWLINWDEPTKNHFAIAEEVTLRGPRERRPDLVLYVNGIAICVIELKNSRTWLSDGIGQLLSNQDPGANAGFFTTAQIVFAGNDSEGLRYGTIGTPAKMFLSWKEDEADDSRFPIDKYLLRMCSKERLIELVHDFVLFDAGEKKLPRVHQYFGIKEAQRAVTRRQGGIIWHTQGSGKSIVMVLLAKWILENNPHARVLIVTDRDELDKQIADVLHDSGLVADPKECRAASGADLMARLGQATPRLLCTLVHKFGRRGVKDFEAFLAQVRSLPSPAIGDLFIFVDECHRTQSGKFHKTMKALLPAAVFIGFTGTPLLKKDRPTSEEVFGDYIHTYKFGEAVGDGVVLDLIYEARDIEQRLGSQHKVDAWFEAKTQGLNVWQKAALREQWATMQQVLSSRSRMNRVVNDIVLDFTIRPRLRSGRGNAILVAKSISEATRYYALFQQTELKGRFALVTSYDPQAADVTREEMGTHSPTAKQFVKQTYTDLLADVVRKPGKTRTESYEDDAKALFIEQPANMRLLIVVAKLLTGFDAPPCTYLYIDKKMQDHGLFQAICRTNRLDGEDKPFGCIVDYKDLFTEVKDVIAVYTSALDRRPGETDPVVLMNSRLKMGKERLDQALESLALLCQDVQPPQGELEHIRYFCGNTERPEDLEERRPLREALYKGTASLVRSFAGIADDLKTAGYSATQATGIKRDMERYVALREIVRRASGEVIDLKAYEADMRHLIDTYIEASDPRTISDFKDVGLLDIIVKSGLADAVARLPTGLRGNRDAVAETIANNVRAKITREHLNDPAFYDTMSAQLTEVLAALREQRITYEKFLAEMARIATRVQSGTQDDTPEALDTPAKRAIYRHLQQQSPLATATAADPVLELALAIDATVRRVKPAGFRGVKAKENVIKEALLPLFGDNQEQVERLFPIIAAQKEY